MSPVTTQNGQALEARGRRLLARLAAAKRRAGGQMAPDRTIHPEPFFVLEYSFSQRAFDLHPAGQRDPWYPGHDWEVVALGAAAALEALAAELRGVLP